jgi:uncharacterized LabA/DUF88 family protein
MLENKRRAAVFIDGSNFYFKMKSLGVKRLKKYGYYALCKDLAGDRKIMTIGYYVGVVRATFSDVKGQKLRRAQIDLFNHLRDQKVIVHKGYLMKNDGVYHEKGVDVKIATDMLVGAYENLYDDAIIISSDTDLLPAMQKVKELKKNVEYVGFGHQPALALQTAATRSRLLLIEELEKFVCEEE